MIWHPLLLAVITVDVVACLLLVAAAASAFRIALFWNPESADRNQIALEGEAETASIRGRLSLWLLLFSYFLLVVGTSNVFHRVIPGAMCGTGVFQALGGSGQKMLIYRALLVVAILFWNELERLNRIDRSYPLTAFNARLLLASSPLALLAMVESARAFNAVNLHRPVDCCAVVYDRFRSLAEARSAAGIPDEFWLGAFLLLSILLGGLAVGGRMFRMKGLALPACLAMAVIAWVPVSAVTLVNILSAYHYGVLQHHCPWCLFLSDYNFVGFPLFGALAVVAVEGLLVFLLPLAVKTEKRLLSPALLRSRRACNTILGAMSIFMLLTCLPPIFWRLRHGVWMGG